MGRERRAFVDDGIYHVWSHGSDRRQLFVRDDDRRSFIDRLVATSRRHGLACIGFCLMGNHYHAVFRTPDGRLSRAMQELHTGYSHAFNKLHGRRAHLFRSRFGARQVTSDSDLLGTLCYLAYNAVRDGFCADPEDWAWSSYRANIGLDPVPSFLSEDALRVAVGGSKWRPRYASFVDANRSRFVTSSTDTSREQATPVDWVDLVAVA